MKAVGHNSRSLRDSHMKEMHTVKSRPSPFNLLMCNSTFAARFMKQSKIFTHTGQHGAVAFLCSNRSN